VAFLVHVVLLLLLLLVVAEKEEEELVLLQLLLLMLRLKIGGFPSLVEQGVGAWLLNPPLVVLLLLLLLLRREVSVKSLAYGLLVEAIDVSIATGAATPAAAAPATAAAMIETSLFMLRGEKEGTKRAGERKFRSSGVRGWASK
jgi:hypothetical protein